MSRIARLRQLLEEPLLVTNLVNVRYLCGFDSSNAALLVERDRVRLFTVDFRYRTRARAVEDVDVVQTKRSLVEELAGGVVGDGSRSETGLPYAQYRTLEKGGLDLVPRERSRRVVARSEGRERARRAPPRLRDHRPRVRAAPRREVRRTART